MPSDDNHDRSASPPREPELKKAKSGGFKWKDKRPRDEDNSARDGGRLERGYRDRSPRRDNFKDDRRDRHRDGERERDSFRRRDDSRDRNNRDRSPRRREDRDRGGDSYRPSRERGEDEKKRDDVTAKFGDYTPREKSEKKDKSEKKEKKPKPVVSNEPMIVVNINDRLGTKAAIPCLASDSVKAFKAMVAAHIGRQPHEIMIKRQGERPFKDVLTLEDYGVSNGVQLDLELDTGD